MTGKELIMYILENNLENEDIFKDGGFLGCLTVDKAAVELGAGQATVRALIELRQLDAVKLGDVLYIIPNDNYKNKKGDKKNA